ncbi:MAG TPA: EVE domain-containing protein [Polyangia bacterium]|nr:EVE domain-containing protein [Polyangia bacterium]
MMPRMARRYWLIKSEPFKYAWDRFVSDGKTQWDGVRSFEARNNLRAMSVGDLALFYHSNEGKEFVGVAKVVRAAYPDPTADEGDWSVVDFAPVKALAKPVTLATVKADAMLKDMSLVKRSRLSVAPVKSDEFERVLSLAKTKLR